MSIISKRTQLATTARGFLVAISGLVFATASAVHAASITDKVSCDVAVATAETNIIKAKLKADDLNILVSLADQAKTACSADDFVKASKITDAIDVKIGEVEVK